ncbi:MAG TPA: hypothetical protein VMD91_07975 [Candidatus Sulfotelmatobacter sp.]|nr:hypothetical protein [Candidatus Sulfotelmatobacter sp.]
MLDLVLAAALAADVSPCADLLVATPKLQIVSAPNRGFDNAIVTVDVRNRGVVAQPNDTRQHLEIVQNGTVLGAQPIPPLGPQRHYPAAFRIQLPARKTHDPLAVTFRYVLDSHNAAQANCSTHNDLLHAVLS